MKSIEELVKMVSIGATLIWNDPDPIEGNDYTVTYIEPIDESFDEDTPILIQYGGGSEAEVFLHELVKKY